MLNLSRILNLNWSWKNKVPDMRVVYLIAGTYRPGGMERVLAGKANWLVRQGVAEVLIVTTDQRGQKPFFELDQRIRQTDLDINYEQNNGASFLNKLVCYPFKQIRHRHRLAMLLRSEKPDVVISMFCNDASFLPRIKDGSRKILEIHFSRYKRLQYGRKGMWALADKWRCKNDKRIAARFDKFVVLTHEDSGYWNAGTPMRNICVIPNSRTFQPLKDRDTSVCHNTVLAVGRYNTQKAFDRLIDVWAGVCSSKDYPGGWKLRIVGDGELRDELQHKIESLGLSNSVLLGGAETEMQSVYSGSDIYAMTSLYEGLPMVLLEAQAAGLPIVSMACKCGPRDVVTDGKDGFLVPEGGVGAMAQRLLLLMNDSDLRESMGQAALRGSDRFDQEIIMWKWVSLLREQ